MDAQLITRRHWITQVACGMGAWALLDLPQRRCPRILRVHQLRQRGVNPRRRLRAGEVFDRPVQRVGEARGIVLRQPQTIDE